MSRTVFELNNIEKCMTEFLCYAGDIFTDALGQQIKESEPNSCNEDNLGWTQIDNIAEISVKKFKQFYSHILGFHGCRPKSLLPFLSKGLLSHRKNTLNCEFHEIFADVPLDKRNQAIAESAEGLDETGKLFFISDDKFDHATGHYLIAGSEHILGLAARLVRMHATGEDYRLRLRNIGVPTIIKMEIPLERLEDKEIESIVKQLISYWGNCICFPDDYHDAESCYLVYGDLDPSCIVGHSHPVEIEDPHSDSPIYISPVQVCDGCH